MLLCGFEMQATCGARDGAANFGFAVTTCTRSTRVVISLSLPYMLLLVTLFSVTQGPCKDLNEFCASWANAGECQNNPGYMNAECRASCDPACGGKGAYVKPADSWETEDLEVALPGSSVVDVSEDELASLVAEAAKNDTQVVTWFYAPWCKQCKIARPGYEASLYRLRLW